MKNYLFVIKNTCNFTGRSGRREFWMFTLAVFIITCLLCLIDFTCGTLWLGTLFSLSMSIPSVALFVRRLRDAGFSPWLTLIALLPLGVYVLMGLAIAGTREEIELSIPESDSLANG